MKAPCNLSSLLRLLDLDFTGMYTGRECSDIASSLTILTLSSVVVVVQECARICYALSDEK